MRDFAKVLSILTLTLCVQCTRALIFQIFCAEHVRHIRPHQRRAPGVSGWGQKRAGCAQRRFFSQVLSAVTLSSKYTRALIFQTVSAAEAGDTNGNDALTLALTGLKRALEHRERADAEARSRTEREALEERETLSDRRASLEAALDGKHEALEGKQEEARQLQGAVDRLQVLHILKSQFCR